MTDPVKPEDELAGTEQPFIQHLIELRDRLLRSVYGIGLVLVVLLFYPGPSKLYDLLALPLVKTLPEGARMIAVGVVSPFLVPIKVTVLAAVALSLPWILYQIWAFVAPGLYKHEKKLVLPLVAASTILFYLGAAFCYFFVFGQAFPAIQKMAPISVTVSPDIEAYLDFVITMFIAFGTAAAMVLTLSVYGHIPIVFVLATAVYFGVFGEIYSLFPATSGDTFGAKFATTNNGMLYTAKGTASLLVPLASLVAAN